MRLSIFGLIMLILFALSVSASRDPVPGYCTLMGYEYKSERDSTSYDIKRYCIFDSEHQCDAGEFYQGNCGAEFIKEIPCASEGEGKWLFQECCKGLYPYSPKYYLGDRKCMQLSFWEKISYYFWKIF